MSTLTREAFMREYSALSEVERKALHRRYWAQFVTPYIIREVESWIGVKWIMDSTDEHFNDIPLRRWDALDGFIRPIGARINKQINGQSVWSLSDTGCVAKEAARQIKESLTS
jgi:hypothetical protein